MENSADKYLHKKFKKQLSIEPQKIQTNNDKEAKTLLSSRAADDDKKNVPDNRTNEQTKQCYKIDESRTDNNKIVPKESTNQNSSSVRNSYFVKSSISDLNEIGNQQVTTNPKTPVNTCISHVISNVSNSSRIVSRVTDTNQLEHPLIRTVNFDTSFNQNEPISNKLSVVEASSILDNIKQTYVTSKLVKADKEDISPSNNHCEEQGEQNKHEVQENNPSLPDKNSGGKYVCTYCNLACSKPSVLQKHIRAHTNERPYPCVSCGFSFKTRSNLYKHCRSRTHANRVLGNKAQEINNEMEVIESHNRPDCTNEQLSLQQVEYNESIIKEQDKRATQQDIKAKPYKPRFHTAKIFFDSCTKEIKDSEKPESPLVKHSNSDLLSIHINELINKNNSIVNSSDPYLMKKRCADNTIADNTNSKEQHKDIINTEEPLNLTNKNRKRCLSQSEVPEPIIQKSLIKELLLKNLYADSNMQCRYCKMIFQTVTEFELHKLRSCRGANKSGMRYSRSSSVNVASILTHNKNAFDNIPHMQNTVFNMKSPGPFLGKTRLVESDKNKSFSFDDVLPTTFPTNDTNKTLYTLSPLVYNDKDKRAPVKLFGGEVKITHTSGETKSFKIDNKEGDKFNNDNNYIEYGSKLSENRVVKSSLQSGGTVLTNKPNYSKQDLVQSQDIIHVYDSPNSPRPHPHDLADKSAFDEHKILDQQRDNNMSKLVTTFSSFNNGVSYKYTNIADFSQKAAKLLAPNLKQVSLTSVAGIHDINKRISESPDSKQEQMSNMEFAQKQIKLAAEPPPAPLVQQNLYNPMNLIVNGKVVRYVPGIPGPVVAETPLDMAYGSNIIGMVQAPSSSPLRLQPSHSPVSSLTENNIPSSSNTSQMQSSSPLDTIRVEKATLKMEELEIKTATAELKSAVVRTVAEIKSSNDTKLPLDNETRKFARPNSLALKPSMAAVKQHHGLTPTMFNQILISPDTPRVAKKYMQHFLHGNYFSYLGLKSSTKPVYCTLNKTQPFYVLMKHFKKLSMYSEWRQQDNKTDKLYGSGYDSRQKQQKYTTAGKTTADLIVHSSYKFMVTETKSKCEEQKTSSVLGGYESNEEYTYIRGRGRGRYVCDQCGIRCKKPSMLKKHIRTHSNDRPYTCSHCNFSFKTKGNLTKHMKSKSHTKNYAASSGSSTSSNQLSGTQSSESETEDSGMDSSDESSTRQQEHEAAYGLLSLSQKTNPNVMTSISQDYQQTASTESVVSFMNTEQIVHVTKTNFAKNKILDQHTNINFIGSKNIPEVRAPEENSTKEVQNLIQFLGKTNMNRPLTYPYTVIVGNEKKKSKCVEESDTKIKLSGDNELKSIKQFNVIMRYGNSETLPPKSDLKIISNVCHEHEKSKPNIDTSIVLMQQQIYNSPPVLKVNDRVIFSENNENMAADLRKRKIPVTENSFKFKVQKNDEVMDLSMATNNEKSNILDIYNGTGYDSVQQINYNNNIHNKIDVSVFKKNFDQPVIENFKTSFANTENCLKQKAFKANEVVHTKPLQVDEKKSHISVNCVIQEQTPLLIERNFKPIEYDNSAMETLADIATKQVKLEKNTLAKSVASEYLKLATKNEFVPNEGAVDNNSIVSTSKEVNELILKPEENKSCTICAKNFNKPSQLRLHMNVHYLERPFRCDSCAVSFRTKGHLQKHERSASHHNKLSSSPALSSSEPRPFKCSDCNIAFRIHGHLAKHLRSKMHIMKLECLAKIPFGLYAELERSNSLLTEINTADGDQCLESLKTLAKKVFINDPNKLNQMEEDS